VRVPPSFEGTPRAVPDNIAINRDDETIIALAARLVPKNMTTKFAMFMVNKSVYNLPFKVSMHKENE
jgi:hypothetical protein